MADTATYEGFTAEERAAMKAHAQDQKKAARRGSRADKAAEAGIHIYAIGFGTTEGAPVPNEGGGFKKDPSGERVISRLDADLLKDVAARGSVRHRPSIYRPIPASTTGPMGLMQALTP